MTWADGGWHGLRRAVWRSRWWKWRRRAIPQNVMRMEEHLVAREDHSRQRLLVDARQLLPLAFTPPDRHRAQKEGVEQRREHQLDAQVTAHIRLHAHAL